MTQETAAPQRHGTAGAVALVALVLLALGMRGPVSSVGPLLQELRADLGLSGAAVALLPALPLVCFGLLSPVAPALSGRLGLHRAVLVGSGALVLGLALRGAGVPGLFVGTVLVGAGIAVVNVLLPAVIKADFADRVPLATALATSSIAVSASLGAGLAQPLRGVTGGPLPSLAVWLLPAGAGLLAWALLTHRRGSTVRGRGALRVLPLLADPVARAVTVFFGLQSLVFYTLLAWLPSVLRDAGVPAQDAGVMLALMAALGAPVAFLVPRWAAGRPSQVRCVLPVTLPTAAGLAGLLLAPAAAPWLWASLLGVGSGAAFPLALTIVVLRSRDSEQAGRLSGAAQGAGYVVAATGPFVIGLLHDATASWRPSLVVLAALVVAQVVVGRAAARDRTVQG